MSLNPKAGMHVSSSTGSICHPVLQQEEKILACLPGIEKRGGERGESNLEKGGITSFNTNRLCQLGIMLCQSKKTRTESDSKLPGYLLPNAHHLACRPAWQVK